MISRKVTVLVQGGLGNQMFCYAVARSYAWHFNRICVLDSHSGYINDQFERVYRLRDLELFDGIEDGLPDKDIRSKVSKFLPMKLRSFVKEKYIGDTNIMAVDFMSNNIYLEGYWQSEKYFKSIKDILVLELKPRIKPSREDLRVLEKIASTNAVFIHIRRVQYSHKLPGSYYEQAISRIKETLKNPTFFVFGDDMEWIKSQRMFRDNCEFVNHNDQHHEMNDFMIMNSCKHAIIANSSFSWWAAWLNDSNDQKVICPNHSGFGLEMADDWLKIEVNY